jgi:hypothetical protein
MDIREHLLFIHAWTGCDTTSAITGKGKQSLLNAMKKSKTLCTMSEAFSDYWATQEEVHNASVDVIREIYGGNPTASLSKMRFVF